MPTQYGSSPGSPGISGAVSDAVAALKSYVGMGKRSVSGNKAEQEEGEALEGAEGNHSSTISSNAGRNNQSTDAQNRY
jgi:hypothetical protein